MKKPVAVVGIADHGGWAILVTVSSENGTPGVIDRRRVALLDESLPSQPYHHEGLELPAPEAQKLVDEVKASASSCARTALATLQTELLNHTVAAISIRERVSVHISETVAEVLASWAATCAADGELYRNALCQAAAALSLEVEAHARRPSIAAAAQELDMDEATLTRFLDATGRALGPPWRKEHKTALAFAMVALNRRSRLAIA